MRQEKKTFTHVSLQDAQSIQPLLKSLAKGMDKGEMVFANEEDEMTLNPEGLIRLKIVASKIDGRHQVNLKISWQVDEVHLQKANTLVLLTE